MAIKQKGKVIFLTVSACWLFFFSLRYTAEMAVMVAQALTLAVKKVIPALFLFSVGAKMLVGADAAGIISRLPLGFLRKALGVSGGGLAAVAIGLFAGFPVGAAILGDLVLRGEMERQEAEDLMPFCNQAGVAFIVGMVGGYFGSARLGVLLYVSQTAATLLALVFTAKKRRRFLPQTMPLGKRPIAVFSVFTRAVRESTAAMLSVTGFIVFFSVFSASLTSAFSDLTPICAMFLSSFLEISSGLFTISAAERIPLGLRVCFSGFFLGFGGISVMMQAADMATAAEISMKKYFGGKMLCAIFMTGFVIMGIVLLY